MTSMSRLASVKSEPTKSQVVEAGYSNSEPLRVTISESGVVAEPPKTPKAPFDFTRDSKDLQPKPFSSKLIENLDAIFQSPKNGVSDRGAVSPLSLVFGDLFSSSQMSKISSSNMTLDIGFGSLSDEIILFIDKANVFDDMATTVLPPPLGRLEKGLEITYQEENMMLKHFFNKLLPLLDAHPRLPWPDLALKYCDFDVARSCFISLACIHIYELRKGGNEYYKKGVAHIHSTMLHLIEQISGLDDGDELKLIQLFVILVLINVHILFAVLEKGKSSLSRYLFKVFGLICQDSEFFESLMNNLQKRSLVVVLSWYDTVSSMVSPDCRLPYCNPDWYGLKSDDLSTAEMMGCPGELFRSMARVCYLRHEIKNGALQDDTTFAVQLEGIKEELLRYRDYVKFEDKADYGLRLKGAQCWTLAIYISLLRLFPTPSRKAVISALVHEFIEVYNSMPSASPIVTQMVWPVYCVGCECKSTFERQHLHKFMTTLYDTAQMGTLHSLKWIVEQIWSLGITLEEALDAWLEPDVDYLPL